MPSFQPAATHRAPPGGEGGELVCQSAADSEADDDVQRLRGEGEANGWGQGGREGLVGMAGREGLVGTGRQGGNYGEKVRLMAGGREGGRDWWGRRGGRDWWGQGGREGTTGKW